MTPFLPEQTIDVLSCQWDGKSRYAQRVLL
jgi:hypothetical protein